MNTKKEYLGMDVTIEKKDLNGKWRYGIIPNVWKIYGANHVWLNLNHVSLNLGKDEIAIVRKFGEKSPFYKNDLEIEIVKWNPNKN